jgi:prophage maintenance system killer protein
LFFSVKQRLISKVNRYLQDQRVDEKGNCCKKSNSSNRGRQKRNRVVVKKATTAAGREKDESLKSSLGNIFQTFGGNQLYPSMEEKAAHLLYFLVKNHHFTDGNKRIAAFLFLWFLEKNNALYHKDGSKRIADNALVAMTLMIAESNPKHKDIIAKVIVNLINKKN